MNLLCLRHPDVQSHVWVIPPPRELMPTVLDQRQEFDVSERVKPASCRLERGVSRDDRLEAYPTGRVARP